MKVDVSRLLDCLSRVAKRQGEEMLVATDRAMIVIRSGGNPTADLREALGASVALASTRDTIETVTAFVTATAKAGLEEPDLLRKGA
jgi:hypothetical protein